MSGTREKSACPVEEVLAQFLQGRMPAEQIEEVGNHIDQCEKCLLVLDRANIAGAASTLNSRFSTAGEFAHEPQLAELTQRARTLRNQFQSPLSVRTQEKEPIPDRIAHYKILSEVGRGSFSRVYLAEDHQGQHFALKTLMLRDADTNLAVFSAERNTLMDLEHEAIMRVFDSGRVEQDQWYLAMPYYHRGSLAELLKLTVNCEYGFAARVISASARGLHHAHLAGFVHRDIKPANILLNDDQPIVSDFGLALHDEAQWEHRGELAGTRAYMAPEQVRHEAHRLDGRTDIWGLGVTLYELLAGHRPFRGESREQIEDEILHRDPKPLRQIDDRIPRELERICLQCLAKPIEARYQTAGDLADDLDHFLKGRINEIHARPTSRKDRLHRWYSRNRATVWLSIAVVALLFVSSFAVTSRRFSQQYNEDLKVVTTLYSAAKDERVSSLATIRNEPDRYRPYLQRELEEHAADERKSVLIRLALLPTSTGFSRDVLSAALHASDLGLDIEMFQRELTPHAERVTPTLWAILESNSSSASNDEWLHAVALLTGIDPDNERWSAVWPNVVERLTKLEDSSISYWVESLLSSRANLAPYLVERFHESTNDRVKQNAAIFLASWLTNQPKQLARLFASADARQFGALRSRVGSHPAMVESLRRLHSKNVGVERDGRHSEEYWIRSSRVGLALAAFDANADWRTLFRFEPTDPRLLTYTTGECKSRGLSFGEIAAQIGKEEDPDVLYGLILAAGTYNRDDMKDVQYKKLIDRLWTQYRQHPDAGIHSAIAWFLFRFGGDQELVQVDRELRSLGVPTDSDRNWYHNETGRMMIIVKGPVSYLMGSDGTDVPASRRFVADIPWSFAVSAAEVWSADLSDEGQASLAHAPDSRVVVGSAIGYCRKLSNLCGISDDEQSLEIRNYTRINPERNHLKIVEQLVVDLSKSGYRLPTDSEWEYIARGRTTTDRFIGTTQTPLSEHYAWAGAKKAPDIVYRRMPNRLGFFDVLGNVKEWTLTRLQDANSPKDLETRREIPTTSELEDIDLSTANLVLRGVGFTPAVHHANSYAKVPGRGYIARADWGFRIAKTHSTIMKGPTHGGQKD